MAPANLWQQSTTCAGGWDADLLPLHINFKELRAVHKSLLAWRAELQGHRVLLFCDNTTVVQLLRKGTSRSALLMAELRQVWTLLHTLKVDLVPVYIASADNPADFPSRHSMSAEWTYRPALHCQRRNVRFVEAATAVSQSALGHHPQGAAQDRRGRRQRGAHCPALAQPGVVAASAAPARALGPFAPTSPLCAATHAPQDRPIRTRHHETHRTGVRRLERLEAWHSGLADCFLGDLPPAFPGRENALKLLLAGRRANTWLGYASKVKRWHDFCDSAGIPAFPARPEHILCYLGYLQEEGRIKASSLQPYLSALNSWHVDMGLPKPAVGHAITMLRRGYGEVQAEDDDEAVRARRPIPAFVMRAILDLGSSTGSVLVRRAATASVLCYAFMLRADSCVRLKHRHVTVTTRGITLQLQVKTRGRDVSTTVHRPGCDEVYHLIRLWIRACSADGAASLWALPSRPARSFCVTLRRQVVPRLLRHPRFASSSRREMGWPFTPLGRSDGGAIYRR
jgi:hypothetical protein